MSDSTAGGLGESAQAPSVCPRHPEIETYIQCQRCRRPMCVNCQRTAAVGFQCVDCVKAGSAQVRQARTQYGGVVRDGAPVVTFSIIAVCVVAFVLQQVSTEFTRTFLYAPFLTFSEPWRLMTSAFLHAPNSIFHLGFNMYLLYLFGPQIELLLGRLRFISVYFTAALGGAVAMLVYAALVGTQDAWLQGMYGASGAVFGLFSAALLIFRQLGRDYSQILVLMGINFALPLLPFFGNIAWQAHLGGALVGAAVTWILIRRDIPAQRRNMWQAIGVGLVWVVLLALTVWAMSQWAVL